MSQKDKVGGRNEDISGRQKLSTCFDFESKWTVGLGLEYLPRPDAWLVPFPYRRDCRLSA